jgi:hypothetical protein
MKTESSPQNEQQPPERPKRPYVAPSLNVLGTVDKVTMTDLADGSPT